MRKIAILGCENSHSRGFMKCMRSHDEYKDVEVVGVYSLDEAAAQKFSADYGVPVLPAFDAAVGKIDGLIVTARHGNDHFRFARPYIDGGIPMFIDKPITVTEEDAVAFMRAAEKGGVRLTGGSCMRCDAFVRELAADLKAAKYGKTMGGYVRAPICQTSVYGGFFFYAQHLVDMVLETFGRYPDGVRAYKNGDNITVLFTYPDYIVSSLLVEENYVYYLSASTEKGEVGKELFMDDVCMSAGFGEFYRLLCGGEQRGTYADFASAVFVVNAVARALESGDYVKVRYPL